VIPKRDAFSVPAMDETQKPAFALREPFWFDMFDGDLAARNKVNGNAMRLTDKHGGHSFRFGGGLGPLRRVRLLPCRRSGALRDPGGLHRLRQVGPPLHDSVLRRVRVIGHRRGV